MKNTYWLYGIAVAIGIVVWIGISMVSGRKEAFDSELYYRIGMPVVCLASAAFGFLEPNKSWRWGILPLLGQFSWMLLTQGPGNLLPLGMIFFGILSVPSIIAARIGAFLRRKRATSSADKFPILAGLSFGIGFLAVGAPNGGGYPTKLRHDVRGLDRRQLCMGRDAPLESKTSRSFFVSMSGV